MTKTQKLLEENPSAKVVYLKPFQDKFIFSEARYPAFISPWGTGKTMSAITKILNEVKKYPFNLGLVLRREWIDLRDSTIKDWQDITKTKLNSDRNSVFSNGTEVMFRHAEELSGRNLQNMNLGFGLIEQGEELDSDDVFHKLRGRLRRCHGCKISPCVCTQWLAVIGNTNGHNWIYNLWKANPQEGFELCGAESSFEMSDILPVETIKDWRKLEFEKPKIFRRFIMNSWDETDAVDVVIQPEWIKNAKGKHIWQIYPIRRIISIDVARYGDDKTVFYAMESSEDKFYKTIAKETYEKKSTMEVVGLAILFAQKNRIKTFAVDEIGVGAGVVDRLKELNYKVVAVNSSSSSSNSEKYYNTRAEIYGTGADIFQDNRVSILENDIELQEQLSWAKYKTIKSNGHIQIESKEDIKSPKRYGASPDYADAFLNGLWALQKVEQEPNPETMHVEKIGWKDGNYVPEWAEVA